MNAVGGIVPLPVDAPLDWRKVTGWFRAAWDLLAFSHGPTPASAADQAQAVTNLQLEELMVEHAEAAYRVAL